MRNTIRRAFALMIIVLSTPLLAQESFHVLEEACIGEKVAACVGKIAIEHESHNNSLCPAGWTVDGASRQVPGRNGLLTPCRLDPGNFIGAELGGVNLPKVQACTTLIRAYPASYSCLVKVDANRMINSLETDVRMLIEQVCAALGGKDCSKIAGK